jgi:putative glutamine amidotransferase
VTGRSEEGIPEVMELEGHPYLLTVQWHPERMRHDRRQMTLFTDFVRACRERKTVEA